MRVDRGRETGYASRTMTEDRKTYCAIRLG